MEFFLFCLGFFTAFIQNISLYILSMVRMFLSLMEALQKCAIRQMRKMKYWQKGMRFCGQAEPGKVKENERVDETW